MSTARYEPILWRQLGGGHLDLLFETESQSCVLAGLKLDSIQLLSRERAPFIWPAHTAAVVDHAQLVAIEARLLPWLRSLARGRPMSTEAIRRFIPSARFERARAAGLVGAAPLERAVVALAPFVYARRFAAGVRVLVTCTDAALACAVLAEGAALVEADAAADAADEFARAWYGVAAETPTGERPDLVVTDRRAAHAAEVIVEIAPAAGSPAVRVDVPSPVPWDLLFSFDAADAPAVSRFGVLAAEAPLRAALPLATPVVFGGSSGTIVLAVSPESRAMRGADHEEVEILARRLGAEGFSASIVEEIGDPQLAAAGLIHIFGSPFEPHTAAFAEFARQRGIAFLFDLPPKADDPSGAREEAPALIHRASVDDAELARFLEAYAQRRLDPTGTAAPSVEEYAAREQRFIESAAHAAAILCTPEDLALLRAALPPAVAGRLTARGVFAEPEPLPGPVGHLVPVGPFAFAHGTIGARSNVLLAAVAAERTGVPLVVAGPVYDVDYLQTLRGSAPQAIVLADAPPSTVAALYRRATLWVDAAPRPRSAAQLLRAVTCGALPVLALESPLARIAGIAAPAFSLLSIGECAAAMHEALTSVDRSQRIAGLQERLALRRDPAAVFSQVMSAYAHAATPA